MYSYLSLVEYRCHRLYINLYTLPQRLHFERNYLNYNFKNIVVKWNEMYVCCRCFVDVRVGIWYTLTTKKRTIGYLQNSPQVHFFLFHHHV